MSGVNDIDVAGSMQRLVWLATETRPNEDPGRPFSPQCSSWQHIIASSYTEYDNAGGAIGDNLQELINFTVPANSAWIVCHVAVQTAPVSVGDVGLGAAPFNYGDFRSNYSLNPYGDYGIVGGTYPQMQWLDQNDGAITPLVPSFAMQAQQVLIPIAAGVEGRLMANFSLQAVTNIIKVFATVWGWLVPPQVANRLQDFKTSWWVRP